MKVIRVNADVYTVELDNFDADRLHLVASINGLEIAGVIKGILYDGILMTLEDMPEIGLRIPPPAPPVKIGTKLEGVKL